MQPTSLNELIARTSKLAYSSGVEEERRRAIRILKSLPKQFSGNDYVLRAVAKAIAELKNE